MATYLIRHSPVLSGEVEVHAAKNAVLPLLAAGLLTEEPLVLKEVPRITDVETLLTILRDCGAQVTRSGTEVSVCALQPQSPLHEENMRRLRASILILGPILARSGSACVGLPGGCAIGQRPIDLHLKGLQALGAQVHPLGGKRQLSGRLSGARIYLDLPSVGATENLMMAAALARGLTVLENAAKEPEIVDLANCLNLMGASISGAGTETITILGVERLHGAVYRPIPDRIEAGTLLCAAAVTEGSVLVRGACAEHLRSLLFKLAETGVGIRETHAGIRLSGSAVSPFEVRTLAYPGFPTDMQAPMTVVALRCHGQSMIHETVFENRFMHVAELCRLGGRIRVENNVALVEGGYPLRGTSLRSTDLRAGAALMLAGLMAEGETLLSDPSGHIERGYQNLPEKLRLLGADIERLGRLPGITSSLFPSVFLCFYNFSASFPKGFDCTFLSESAIMDAAFWPPGAGRDRKGASLACILKSGIFAKSPKFFRN